VDIINSCVKLLKLSEIAYKIIVVSLMAERLSKVYGTEMDKVNCPFFYKIGACRYGDSCERIHNKPPISETVLLEHMYENSAI
jgi:hypothetical protein